MQTRLLRRASFRLKEISHSEPRSYYRQHSELPADTLVCNLDTFRLLNYLLFSSIKSDGNLTVFFLDGILLPIRDKKEATHSHISCWTINDYGSVLLKEGHDKMA